MTISNFPMYKQEENFTCGQASMRSMVKYHKDIEVPERIICNIGQEAEKYMKSQEHEGYKTVDEGLDFTGMRAIARNFGLAGVVGYDLDRKFLNHFLRREIPILICWVPDGEEVTIENGRAIIGGHYSIVIDLKGNVVKLADSSRDKEKFYNVNYEELEAKWTKGYFNNKGVCKERRERWGAVFWDRDDHIEVPNWMRVGRF